MDKLDRLMVKVFKEIQSFNVADPVTELLDLICSFANYPGYKLRYDEYGPFGDPNQLICCDSSEMDQQRDQQLKHVEGQLTHTKAQLTQTTIALEHSQRHNARLQHNLDLLECPQCDSTLVWKRVQAKRTMVRDRNKRMKMRCLLRSKDGHRKWSVNGSPWSTST